MIMLTILTNRINPSQHYQLLIAIVIRSSSEQLATLVQVVEAAVEIATALPQ